MRLGAVCRPTALLALSLACAAALAQPADLSAEPSRADKPVPGVRVSATPGAGVAAPSAPKTEAGPSWNELTSEQHAALRPLAARWSSLSANQKRKWIALSRTHDKLSPQESARMHSRMSTWATLSPSERAQARLNFAESRELGPQDKSAQWEAYQALPNEQKMDLVRQSAKPTGASVAATGAPKLKLTPQPELGVDQAPAAAGHRRLKSKLIQGENLDLNTLLPQPSPEPPQKQKP